MKYLKYIFGIQLLIGSIWTFYYSIYWIGFLLLALSSFILIPLIHKLLKKKVGGFKAGCLISSVFLIGLTLFAFSYLRSLLTPVDTDGRNYISVYAFEQNLLNSIQPCFDSYDKAFSKTIKYQDEQCNLISQAKAACSSAQQGVDNINTPAGSNTEIMNLLIEAKSDAKNSVQAWENFFSFYNDQCITKSSTINATEVKLQLISAVKNKYLMEMKIKKAKSINQ